MNKFYVKKDFVERGHGSMKWINLAYCRDRYRALVGTMMNLAIPSSCAVLGAFAQSPKAHISFVMFVSLSSCISAASTGSIFVIIFMLGTFMTKTCR